MLPWIDQLIEVLKQKAILKTVKVKSELVSSLKYSVLVQAFDHRYYGL